MEPHPSQFVVAIDPGYRTRLDQTLFYGSVARSLLPRTHSALSSCLAPSQGRLRAASEYLESILARFANLCVAHDELGRVAQREGWLDGDNGTLGEQLYHLQWSLVLVTGSLDALTWVVVKRAGSTPNRREVSWRKLVAKDPPRWLSDARSDDATAMRKAARSHPQRPLADLAYDLRDALQHRLPPRAGVACIQDNLGIDRAKLAALHVDATLGQTAAIADGPGMLRFTGHQYLLPASFQAGLLTGMAQLVDELIGVVDWPDGHWWQANQSWAQQGREQLRPALPGRLRASAPADTYLTECA
jgi:hypothetical protein